MKQFTCISVWVLLLFSLSVKAESEKVKHDFTTMKSDSITYASGNKSATTDLLTYTCYKNGAFAPVALRPHLTLYYKNDSVKTTRVDELKRIIVYINALAAPSNFQIYLSKNGVDFGSPLSEGVTYNSSGFIDAVFPRGNYYIKIVATGSNSHAIKQIDYYLDHCNCFEYVP